MTTDLPFAERTLTSLLARRVAAAPDDTLVRHPGGTRTARATAERAHELAGALAATGVGAGERVATLLHNRIELLDLWLACAQLGAVLVPLNTAARGRQLGHMLANSEPRLLVVEPELRELLAYAEPAPNVPVVWEPQDVAAAADEPPPPRKADPRATIAILYTSGTTGVSKGVQCPSAQFYWWAKLTGGELGVRAQDTLHTVLPLFHTNALNAFCQALLAGSTYSFGTRFSASRFWDEIRDRDATVTYLLGAMVHILLKAPESERDRAHRVRIALAPATPADAAARFTERFGVELLDGYGSTETNMILSNRRGGYRPGTMGVPLEEFEAQVVDENDCAVADGVAGELVLRSREPFAFATGYFRMPEATVDAWRNLWFHTGDRVVREQDGAFRFLDRIKDAIRRRGENISSLEVEQALQAHPAVVAAAAVPVPAELGEDEVMAFVLVREGETVEPEELIRWCEPRLAYFAIPRYLELVDELPLTENGKIRKFVLRERGVGPATWDREAAGVQLRR